MDPTGKGQVPDRLDATCKGCCSRTIPATAGKVISPARTLGACFSFGKWSVGFTLWAKRSGASDSTE